ncbi:hypothetical protein [Pseudonocardia sp. TRM90224]|uniref:hypothetical protein n=1 Tax=Pseudonocardia sp. TRM90224 TaxID=2812678 RepID=UPI001E52C691|nr:hypothetical protein [Pseudonocardia sp. TRM90224]
MDILSFLIPAAALVWVVSRQFVGRYVSMRRTAVVPLVLVVLGVAEATSAHLHWSWLAIAVVGIDLLITAALGAVRGGATALTLREGYLYQRGGVLSLVLWLISIATRIGVAVLFAGSSAEPALTATLMVSIGISLAAQFAVLAVRVRADGRPLRPADRRGATAGSTLPR